MNMKNFLRESDTTIRVLIAIAIASILFIAYGLWVESRAGSIDVYVTGQGAAIFLDEKRAGTSNAAGQIITLERVRPGEHSVLVYADGYFPWEKTVKVRNGETTQVRMFSVRSEFNASHQKTNFTNEENVLIETLFEDSKASRKTSFSGDGNVEIRKEDNKIFATWLGSTSYLPDFFCDNTECKNNLVVFNSEVGNIDTIGFYPNRDDVVLFSVGGNIHAIEIDKRGIQNFQPIYTGEQAHFAADDQTSTLYIKDRDLLFGIAI